MSVLDGPGTANKRAPNFTARDNEILTDLVRENANEIESSRKDNIGLGRKREAWELVTRNFNATIGISVQRTTAQLQGAWNNIAKRAKKEYSQVKRDLMVTGGGSSAVNEPEVGSILDKASGIVGKRLQPVLNFYDSDANFEAKRRRDAMNRERYVSDSFADKEDDDENLRDRFNDESSRDSLNSTFGSENLDRSGFAVSSSKASLLRRPQSVGSGLHLKVLPDDSQVQLFLDKEKNADCVMLNDRETAKHIAPFKFGGSRAKAGVEKNNKPASSILQMAESEHEAKMKEQKLRSEILRLKYKNERFKLVIAQKRAESEGLDAQELDDEFESEFKQLSGFIASQNTQ